MKVLWDVVSTGHYTSSDGQTPFKIDNQSRQRKKKTFNTRDPKCFKWLKMNRLFMYHDIVQEIIFNGFPFQIDSIHQ